MLSLIKQYKWVLAGLLALGLVAVGWFGHRWFTKPVEHTTIVQVPVSIGGGPAKVEEQHPNGTVTPGVHYSSGIDAPKPPDDDPTFKPDDTTIITLPVYKPVRVYHQNALKFLNQPDDSVKVWVDSRVWATYEDGEVIKGVHADTTFINDKSITFPLRVKTLVPASRPNAFGIKYGLNTKDIGAWYERDWSIVRTGLDLDFTRHEGVQATARIGLRF